MAGVDDDQRPGIAGTADGRRRRIGSALLRALPVGKREVAHESVAIGRDQIEHHPRRHTLGRRQHESLVHADRPLGVDHDPRPALHDKAVAERLDQPPAGLAGLGREPEGDLRQVDDHPVRRCQSKDGQVDLVGEIEDQAGLAIVAGQPHVGRRRPIGRRRGKCQKQGDQGAK